MSASDESIRSVMLPVTVGGDRRVNKKSNSV